MAGLLPAELFHVAESRPRAGRCEVRIARFSFTSDSLIVKLRGGDPALRDPKKSSGHHGTTTLVAFKRDVLVMWRYVRCGADGGLPLFLLPLAKMVIRG